MSTERLGHKASGGNADTKSRRAPFTYDAWNSPELISKISEVAGVDVIPHMDFEIANINITWNGQTTEVVKNPEKDPLGDGTSAVAWHYDSVPFVCVVMLSDCTDMVGGETALRLPSGEIKKVRGPSMVHPQFITAKLGGFVLTHPRELPLSCRAATSSTKH